MIIRFKLISALLLLASFVCALPTRAQGGQATPIRSAATLPATCTAGTATVPADLINMAGNLYLCTATNVWTQVPAKTTANTWTQKQTFSADPLFGSVAPWTDVRAYPFSAVCDGTTDSTTGIVATFTSLATSGGTAFLPDGCKLTPPSTLPASGSGFYAPIINLGGQLNLTSTLHLNNYYTLGCQNPALRNPANFGAPIAMEKFCPILSTTAFGFTPLISEESNAFVLKDLYLNLFCGSGLKIFPTGNGDVGTVENVFSQGGNCAGNSSGVEQDYGFGVLYKGGGFTSSRIGTAPSMWFHSLAAMDPPGSLTTLDHTYMAAHGIRFDTSGSSCSGSGISSNFRSIQQLYENANEEGHTPPDVNSSFITYDIAHCTYTGDLLDSPEQVDATGIVPLVTVLNTANSSFQAVYGEFLLNPVTDGAPVPFFNAQPSSSSGAPGGQLRGTTVFAPGQITNYLGLYGYNCSYFVYITTGQINCNAQTNLPVADIAGHAIGMASPASDIICTASTMGGALATGTYYVIAAAEGINAAGSAAESVLSNEYAIPVTGPTGSIACGNGDTNGIFPFGATGIRFYYGTAGSMQESVYERGNPTGGNYNTFTIVGSGAVSATPAQLTPNPATMAVTDVLQGQYETVAMSDRVTYPQPACFGIGGRCQSLGNFRTQIFGNVALHVGAFDAILTHANTGNRTYTLPDVSGTFCLTTTGCGAAYSIKPCGFVITGTGAGGILQNSDMGPTLDGNECLIDAPSTVIEIDVSSDAGTPSIILGRNRGGTVANLVSSALAAAGPSVTACARTTAITCQFSASTASATLQNTALTGGSGASDWLGVVSGTADGVAHRITVYIERSIP